MWAADLEKQIVVFLLLLLCFYTNTGIAQQVSAAGSPAVQDARQSAGVKEAGTLAPAPASQEQSSAKESQRADDEKVPEIPGAIVRVLKDGETLPQRKDPDYEDWSRPELTVGMPMEAIPMGNAQGDGFTREFWRLQWREYDPIDLWVIKPASVKRPAVILYLYSYDASNERYKNDDFCKFLTRNGVAAVGFVSAVSEQRFHDRPQMQTFVSELQEALGTTTHDVQMILNFLEKRGDMDMNRVGMWADGSGAAIAILASAVDSRIKMLDLLNPWGDWPDWLAKSSLVLEDRRPDYLKPFFLSQVVNLDPLQYFSKVKAQKVRLQYIKSGISVTPAIVRQNMEAAAPSKAEIVHYEDKKAFLTGVAAKGIGFEWIKTNLFILGLPNETRYRTKAGLEGKDSEPQ